MNRKQRAEAVKTAAAAEWRRAGGKRLEKVRNGRRLVITKEPDFILNADGEIIGVDVWVQLFEADGKTEVPIDPHRRIINPPTVPRSGIRETRDESGRVVSRELTPDPLAAFYEAVWDSIETAPNAKGWRTRGTVTTIFGDTADGTVVSTSTTYSEARAGSSLTVPSASSFDNGLVGQYRTGSGSCYCHESFFAFDTSAIGDTDNVTSVTLEMAIRVRSLTSSGFTVEVRAYDWGESVTTDDWVAGDSLGTFDLVASATASSGSMGGYQTFTSEPAFLSVPNLKTGFVRLLVNSSRHRLGQAPPVGTDEFIAYFTADRDGTSQDPKLTIVHEAGAEEHSGGSTAPVTVTASGSGRAGTSGGSSAAVEVAASGTGEPQTAGGATATVTVTPSGTGEPQTAGGASAAVVVSVESGGRASLSGGSTATVSVAATGHGVSGSASGGSSAVVEVTATGGGIARFRSDLNVIVGPSRTGYAVGPSRVGNTVGPSRVERGR